MRTLPKNYYQIVLLYSSEIEIGEFQLFALKFYQFLYKNGAENLSIDLVGESKLAYPIFRNETAQYVQIQLQISPKGLKKFMDLIRVDQNVLRKYVNSTLKA